MLNRSFILVITALSVLTAACGAKFSKKGQAPAANGQSGPVATPPPPVSGYHTLNPNAPAVAPAAQNYPHSTLGPYADPTLLDNGKWVEIQGQRFYRPNLGRVQDGSGWEPYQDGRWTYDNQRGWTWVSNDPWGHLTDHYGVWRHHGRYGWLWLPFQTMEYQPHCVTWFDEGDNIGWYPYYADYPDAYRWTDAHGFDDGYWHRDRLMVGFQASGFRFHIGFTMVNRSHATQARIRSHLIRDTRLVFDFAFRAHRNGRDRIGRHPGGDLRRSHDFVQRFSREQAPRGDAHTVRSRGGAQILQPFNGRGADRDRDRDRDGDGNGDGRRNRDAGRDRDHGDSSHNRRGSSWSDNQTRGDSRRSQGPQATPTPERRGSSGQTTTQGPATPTTPVIIAPPAARTDLDRRDDKRRETRREGDSRGERGRPDLSGGTPSNSDSAPTDVHSRRNGRRH